LRYETRAEPVDELGNRVPDKLHGAALLLGARFPPAKIDEHGNYVKRHAADYGLSEARAYARMLIATNQRVDRVQLYESVHDDAGDWQEDRYLETIARSPLQIHCPECWTTVATGPDPTDSLRRIMAGHRDPAQRGIGPLCEGSRISVPFPGHRSHVQARAETEQAASHHRQRQLNAPSGQIGGDDDLELQAARWLANLPDWVIPHAVARLTVHDAGEIRDILGFHYPEIGIDFGPNAGPAYDACTTRLDPEERASPVTRAVTARHAAPGGLPQARPGARIPAAHRGGLVSDRHASSPRVPFDPRPPAAAYRRSTEPPSRG